MCLVCLVLLDYMNHVSLYVETDIHPLLIAGWSTWYPCPTHLPSPYLRASVALSDAQKHQTPRPNFGELTGGNRIPTHADGLSRREDCSLSCGAIRLRGYSVTGHRNEIAGVVHSRCQMSDADVHGVHGVHAVPRLLRYFRIRSEYSVVSVCLTNADFLADCKKTCRHLLDRWVTLCNPAPCDAHTAAHTFRSNSKTVPASAKVEG